MGSLFHSDKEVQDHAVCREGDVDSILQDILFKFLDHRATVNAGCYCTTLQHVKEAIWRKQPGLLTEKMILLHDKALPYTACVTVQLGEQTQ
jgi:hypothetical protein